MTSMIDRYLIRYCLGVVDQGSFSAAAASARVTQPTLSAGIAKLEALLGQQLFDRSGRRVRLTEAGTRFVDHARRIEAEFAAAERAVQATPPHRLIRIGVAPTVSTIALGAALAAARAAAPDERIEIVEGRTSELQGKLDHGRIDALLGPGVARDGRTCGCSKKAMASRWRRDAPARPPRQCDCGGYRRRDDDRAAPVRGVAAGQPLLHRARRPPVHGGPDGERRSRERPMWRRGWALR
jgi:DNA-binding transcriptional LysR family regulator